VITRFGVSVSGSRLESRYSECDGGAFRENEGNAMEDKNIKAATAMGTNRPRQGDAFWGEMITAWKASGIGARRFCREHSLAVSPFSLWRKKLLSPGKEIKQPLAVTRMRH
jgi:hypothetical protein